MVSAADTRVVLISSSQLLSVISLLSSDKPNLDSPANVDAAKEIRTDFISTSYNLLQFHVTDFGPQP